MFYLDKSKTPSFVHCNGYHTVRTETDLQPFWSIQTKLFKFIIHRDRNLTYMPLQNHFVQDLCTNFNTDELLTSIWIILFKFSTTIIITDLINVYFPFKLFRFQLMGDLLADEHWSHDNQNDNMTIMKSRAKELLFGKRNHSRYYTIPENGIV